MLSAHAGACSVAVSCGDMAAVAAYRAEIANTLQQLQLFRRLVAEAARPARMTEPTARPARTTTASPRVRNCRRASPPVQYTRFVLVVVREGVHSRA